MFPELSIRDGNNRGFPSVSRPQIVGFLSLDGSRRLLNDTSNLKFARQFDEERKVSFNLNHDIARTVRADKDRDERITILLKYLLAQEPRLLTFLHSDKKVNIDKARFFCYRGLLSCVANTPYENRDGWRIVATLYHGCIFLCALETEEKKKVKQEMTEKDILFSSWGFKFEQYMLSDTPTSKPDLSTPLNENEEFSLVFSLQISKHQLLYAAEMDGILCDKDTSPPPENGDHDTVIKYLSEKKFIELKTSRHNESSRQEENFWKFKARKWWCQSYLAGVDKIICGFRDDSGVVDTLKLYHMNELAQKGSMFWRGDVCFYFLDTFLTYVKRCLASELTRKRGERCLKDVVSLPATSLQFRWRPNERVRVVPHTERDVILPDWFLQNFGKYCSVSE